MYALAITIAAGLALLLLIAGAYWLARRAAVGGGLSIGEWRWYPSPLALLILLPVAGFVLWRFFPALLFIPMILPFFWRRRGRLGPFAVWTRRRRRRHDEEDIEGDSRSLDDQ